MDNNQRARMAAIQKAMADIAMEMLDLQGFGESVTADAAVPPAALTEEQYQTRLLALVPPLVTVVRGLWDMHVERLPHTQPAETETAHLPPHTTQELLGMIAAVQTVWMMHLGELPHPPVCHRPSEESS